MLRQDRGSALILLYLAFWALGKLMIHIAKRNKQKEEPFPGSRPWQGMMKTGTDALRASVFGFIIIFPHKNVKTITL